MEDKYSIKQMILFIIIIVAILGIFYGITVLVTEKKNNKTTDTTEDITEEATIDYDTILVQNIFNQTGDSYYVLASFDDDENVTDYNSSIATYKEKENALKVYNIDLSSAFNKTYVAEESNFEGEYPIFKETTLLKIENKVVTEHYEGKDDIETFLSTLTEE